MADSRKGPASPGRDPDRGPGGYRAGLRIGAGLAASGFVLAVSFGALARQQGWGPVAPVAASVAVFSGTAQFALLSALAGGGAAWTAVASAALVNLRFLPMTLAVTPALRGGRLRRAAEGQAVVDGSWAAAHRGNGRFDRELMLAATLVQWPAWVAGTALGVVVAPDPALVRAWGLDVVFPAFFAVLLVPELRAGRRVWPAALAGAAVTAGSLLVVPTGAALLAGSCAALLGLRTRRRLPC